MLSIDDLLSPQTSAQVQDSVLSVCESLGLSTSTWRSGDPTRTIVAALSRAYSGFTETMVSGIKMGLLPVAEGVWLRLLAKYVYDVEHIEATFAQGEITVDNASGGLYSFAAGDYTVKASALGKTYVNTAAFTINPLETGVIVPIQAQEIGASSTAAPGEIDTPVTQAVGLTVTNAEAVAGEDEETDVALRERCLDSLGALSPAGPAGAYQYVAKTPALNGGATVTRVKVLAADGSGVVTVVVTNDEGAIADVTGIQDGIDLNAVPETVTATVVSATAVAIAVTATVYVDSASGLTSGAVEDLVVAALESYVKALPIGGIDLGSGGQVLWRALLGAIEHASPYILQATLSPETDVALAETEVATLDEGDITLTVTFL